MMGEYLRKLLAASLITKELANPSGKTSNDNQH